MGFEEYFQPPFSVFLLWALFLCAIVLFQPIRFVVKRFLQCIGCSVCADAEVEESVDDRRIEDDNHGDYWNHLSADRKLEIDNLRSIAILRYMAKYTLTLTEKNMITIETSRRVSIEPIAPPTEINEANNSLITDEMTEIEEKNNRSIASSVETDIEEGYQSEKELSNQKEELLQVLECSGAYTHIMVPLAGHPNGGEGVNNETTEPTPKSNWHPSLPKFMSSQDKSTSKDTPAEDEESNNERTVPIFCAVCLMEYEVSERVCWSSNKECTHVFHEDCILQWLVSSGRTKSKRRWFPDNISERRLMCYQLECPCCRQDFVSKETRSDNTEDSDHVGRSALEA